jgi:ADP-ribosylglycohydrolase
MVMASFLGDALALGAHWIYDTEALVEKFGRVESLLKPLPNSFHPTKEKGEFTHYGDQAFILLESLAAQKKFDLKDFSSRWRNLFDHYDGYMDQATRITLSNYDAGKPLEEAGSASNDLAGASRIAPLVYCYRKDLEALVDAAEAQTKMTHNDSITVKSAAFFATVTGHVLKGNTPGESIDEVLKSSPAESPIADWVRQGLESKKEDSVSTITRFGQTCHTPDAFPGVVHLICKYEHDLKEALIQSVMAGGDSAARGMMVGMVLGAHLGTDSLPKAWISDLKKGKQILELIEIL